MSISQESLQDPYPPSGVVRIEESSGSSSTITNIQHDRIFDLRNLFDT